MLRNALVKARGKERPRTVITDALQSIQDLTEAYVEDETTQALILAEVEMIRTELAIAGAEELDYAVDMALEIPWFYRRGVRKTIMDILKEKIDEIGFNPFIAIGFQYEDSSNPDDENFYSSVLTKRNNEYTLSAAGHIKNYKGVRFRGFIRRLIDYAVSADYPEEVE